MVEVSLRLCLCGGGEHRVRCALPPQGLQLTTGDTLVQVIGRHAVLGQRLQLGRAAAHRGPVHGVRASCRPSVSVAPAAHDIDVLQAHRLTEGHAPPCFGGVIGGQLIRASAVGAPRLETPSTTGQSSPCRAVASLSVRPSALLGCYASDGARPRGPALVAVAGIPLPLVGATAVGARGPQQGDRRGAHRVLSSLSSLTVVRCWGGPGARPRRGRAGAGWSRGAVGVVQ